MSEVIAADTEQVNLAWRIARPHLSSERLRHTEGTARAAHWLAPLLGADPDRAVVAAILHDIARDLCPADLVLSAQSAGIIVRTADIISPILLHGRVAALIARESGISDQDVLDAVERHVTGKSGWTSLDETVYLADKIEDGRDYPGVYEVRELVRAGKPRAALREALKNAIAYSMDNVPYFVDPETVVVFNEVSQELKEAPEH